MGDWSKKRKGFVPTSIRAKMFCGMFGLSVFLVLLVNLIVCRKYLRDLEADAVAYTGDTVQKIAENMTNTISALEENMMYKITYSDIFGYQKNLENAAAFSVEQNMKTFAELVKSSTFQVDTVYIQDRYNCRFYWDRSGASHKEVRVFKKTDAGRYITENYDALASRRGTTLWRRFEDCPGKLFLIKTVLNQNTLMYEGILCVVIDELYMEEMGKNLNFHMVIYDDENALLYSEVSLLDAARDYAGELREKGDIKKDSGYLTVSAKVRKKDWTVAGFISQKEFYRGMMELLRQLFLLELLFILLSALLAAWLSKNMTGNISALIGSFRRIGQGEEVGDIQYVSRDETAYLCEKFNDMNHRLKDSIAQMAWDRTQKEKAEYNALLAQMNPHFLYNTLESINALAKLQGQQEISGAIAKLAGLLRVSLTGKEQEITLEEELSYVEQYLELQKLVSGEGLEWEIATLPEVRKNRVPKLLLQPLVENAVIHGFENMLKPEMLVIVAKQADGRLLIEICDNGQGMEQTLADRMLTEDGEEKKNRDRAHIGLRSIQQRIHYLYGPEYGLQITSVKGEGTVVRVCLPLQRE